MAPVLVLRRFADADGGPHMFCVHGESRSDEVRHLAKNGISLS